MVPENLVTQQKIVRNALLAASTIGHLAHPMTELKEKSGQTSLGTAKEEVTAQSARATLTVLPMQIETIHVALNLVVPIPELIAGQPLGQIVLGSQELLLLARTAPLLTGAILTAPSVQRVQTLTVLGNHVLQDRIDQSAQEIQGALLLVQTRANMTETETHTARIEFHVIAQETRAL
jgi:hypothetical protein